MKSPATSPALRMAVLLLAVHPVVFAAPLRVASLHPIMSDLARQVGGEAVEVIDLMPAGSNPHLYYPTPANLKEASAADLILASGKGMEPYLGEFAESLGADVPIYEVGRAVPSLRVGDNEVFVCCPSHAKGALDPHWWHSIQNTRRAASALAEEFAKAHPERADYFRSRADEYADRLRALYDWAKTQIQSVPLADRELTTAHAAFGYLCREMGIRSITILGLTADHDADPAHLKDVIQTLKKEKVRAVFPEDGANPKILETLAQEAGVQIGGHLHGDMIGGHDASYEDMIRCNINTIVSALKGE